MAVAVCSARITEQQYIPCIRVSVNAVFGPPPQQVVGHKLSRLRTAADTQITLVGTHIIDAVRNDLAFRQMLIVMIIDL